MEFLIDQTGTKNIPNNHKNMTDNELMCYYNICDYTCTVSTIYM